MKTCIVRKGLPRIDAIPKVSGEAQYTVDLKMPGLIVGKILRSPRAHARIKSIDTSAAKALNGRPRRRSPRRTCPTTSSASTSGWPTSTSSAPTRCATSATRSPPWPPSTRTPPKRPSSSSRSSTSRCPLVLDIDEAMKPGAPLVHDDKDSNRTWTVERLFGDPDKALAECDYVVEGTYVTHQLAHSCLEVSNCIAKWDKNDQLTIWTNAQAPHTQRQEVARILGIPRRNVRVINSFMGGGFGSKLVMDMKLPIAAVLSRMTGRPVRIVNTRSEEFTTAKTRYPYTLHLKTGATKDGKIVVRDLKLIGDAGAYHDKGPATINFSSMMFGTLYNVPNIRFDGRARLHEQGDGDGVPRLRQPAGHVRHRVAARRAGGEDGDGPGRASAPQLQPPRTRPRPAGPRSAAAA